MNRFMTYDGKMPVWLDDLDFIQDSFKDTIKDLVVGLVGSEPQCVVLSGCEISPAGSLNYSYTKGVVYIDGEILAVPAGSYSIPSGAGSSIYPALIKVEEYDNSGDRNVISDGSNVSCYKKSYAKIRPLRGDFSPYLLKNAIYLRDFLRSKVLFDAEDESDSAIVKIRLIRQPGGIYVLTGRYKAKTTVAGPMCYFEIPVSSFDFIHLLFNSEESQTSMPGQTIFSSNFIEDDNSPDAIESIKETKLYAKFEKISSEKLRLAIYSNDENLRAENIGQFSTVLNTY